MLPDYNEFTDEAVNLRDLYFAPNPINPEEFLSDCLLFCRKYPDLAAKYVASESYRIFKVHRDAPLILSNPNNKAFFSFFTRKTLFQNCNEMAGICSAVIMQSDNNDYAMLVATAAFHAIFNNHLAMIHASQIDYETILGSCAWLCGHARQAGPFQE